MFPHWQALIVLDSVRQGLLGSCSDPQSINWLGQVTVERPRKLTTVCTKTRLINLAQVHASHQSRRTKEPWCDPRCSRLRHARPSFDTTGPIAVMSLVVRYPLLRYVLQSSSWLIICATGVTEKSYQPNVPSMLLS